MQAYRSDMLIVRYAPIPLDASAESERHLPLNEMQDAMSQYAAGLKGNDVMMALRHRGTYSRRARSGLIQLREVIMKLLQTAVFVVAGVLASTAIGADALDPGVQELKESLSLTEKQVQELDKIFKEVRAKREAQLKERREVYRKMQEQIAAVLTKEQAKKYENMYNQPPPHPKDEETRSKSPPPPATE